MSQAYASGEKAIGFCDRCGFQYLLHELRTETVNLNVTNIRVCESCFDPDQPQNSLGRYDFVDPQALRDPRPNGQEGGRYGDSIRFDFDTNASALLWNSTGGAEDFWTLAWQSETETVTLTADNATDPRLFRATSVADPISIDPSVYRYVRCRMKVNNFGADRYSWDGSFWWGHGPSGFTPNYSIRNDGGRPDFESMGDPWVLLTWDMLGVDNWINSVYPDVPVISLRFDFLTLIDTVVEIDYISIDKGPSQA